MSGRTRGFSLIELVVTLAIMGIVLSLGLPLLSSYTGNIKLRAAAENFLAGVHLARGEAIRFNRRVEVILTNAAPVADSGPQGSDFPAMVEESNDNLGALVTTGKEAVNEPSAKASSAVDPSYNWLVRTLPLAGGACGANSAASQAAACWFITGRRGAEGSGASSDSASPVLIEGPASVVFTPLGATVGGAAEFNISNPNGGACAANGGPMRCLRVRVEVGGRIKLCDPAATTAGDTRAC